MTKLLMFCLLLYLAAFGAVWIKRGTFIYPLDPTPSDPQAIGLQEVKQAVVTAKDGTELVAWTRPPNNGLPTLVYFHGNAGNLASRAPRFDILSRRGFGFVAAAYRGSSGSGGAPSEVTLTADSELIYEMLAAGAFGWHAEKTVLYGESLGTGVAVKLASKVKADALILEAPFTSVVERAAQQMWMFPVRWILDERWESIKHIQSVTTPLLVLHGTADPVMPIEFGKRLFQAAPMASKQFVALDGAGHLVWNEEGQAALFEYLDQL